LVFWGICPNVVGSSLTSYKLLEKLKERSFDFDRLIMEQACELNFELIIPEILSFFSFQLRHSAETIPNGIIHQNLLCDFRF
jgi:hypothetical protein